MQVRVRFLREWQGYQPGDHAEFGELIALPILADGTAERFDGREDEFHRLGMPVSAQEAAGRLVPERAGPEARGDMGLFEE